MRRLVLTLLTALLASLVAGVSVPAPPARASNTLTAMFEDDSGMQSDPLGTLQQLRQLGVQEIRVPVRWQLVAPSRRPRGFNPADPGSRGYNWSLYDTIDRDAAQYDIAVLFDLAGGAPPWANGPGAHGHSQWEPSAAQYGLFVKAAGLRYSGSYDPVRRRVIHGGKGDLPRVRSWSIWNEPDYGPSLAPQGLPGHLTIDYAPQMYRNLLETAWRGLAETGHLHDTIMFGELAPRGYSYWGVFSGMRPMVFLRSLYCLDSRYRPLRGYAARVRGCPSTAAASRRFAAQNPALFEATGVSDHPYMRWYPPNREQNPDPVTHQGIGDYTTLGTMGTLERGLDRMLRAYGWHRHLAIFDTEFGYLTSPPKHPQQPERGGMRYPWVSQATAAYYLNWAEYLHWGDPRMQSFFQYLLYDYEFPTAKNDWGGFASGLISYAPGHAGRRKPTYDAWRLPLYMPVTSARSGSRLEVWGCIRPAYFALLEGDGPQTGQIQVAPGTHPSSRAFTTVATVTVSSERSCYFDTRLPFTGHGVHTVRLVWHYPRIDTMGYFDPLNTNGPPAYSRSIQLTLH